MTTQPPRAAGVLLHPTSLPGPHGQGDLGPSAYHFVDWLASAGQRLWQWLPTTPIGPGHSPYQSVSAFAGSPWLVALEPLIECGWLTAPEVPAFDPHRVDFERVIPWRAQCLRQAHAGFVARATAAQRDDYARWCAAHDQATWLADYALFMTLATLAPDVGWWDWPAPWRARDPAALRELRQTHAHEIDFWCFVQWCFDTQCAALKDHAHRQGVQLMGDLPIFIAHHSADCWSRPDLYRLGADGQPTVVAGVPPDAFSATGQRWGNPLYRWDRMADDGFAWWIARLRRALRQVDLLRIDHFRGFAATYEIPADCPTALDGQWRTGPGQALFDALARAFGPLPLVAEDLGVITPDVVALLHSSGLPGMKVLQFAFGDDADNPYLPHHHTPASVVYTGTHDNDTTQGWWHHAGEREREFVCRYLACGGHDVHWAMIRAAANSVARWALWPLQDVLGLDHTHRMNTPGTMGGDNWRWRFSWDQVGAEPTRVLGLITAASGRAPLALLGLPPA